MRKPAYNSDSYALLRHLYDAGSDALYVKAQVASDSNGASENDYYTFALANAGGSTVAVRVQLSELTSGLNIVPVDSGMVWHYSGSLDGSGVATLDFQDIGYPGWISDIAVWNYSDDPQRGVVWAVTLRVDLSDSSAPSSPNRLAHALRVDQTAETEPPVAIYNYPQLSASYGGDLLDDTNLPLDTNDWQSVTEPGDECTGAVSIDRYGIGASTFDGEPSRMTSVGENEFYANPTFEADVAEDDLGVLLASMRIADWGNAADDTTDFYSPKWDEINFAGEPGDRDYLDIITGSGDPHFAATCIDYEGAGYCPFVETVEEGGEHWDQCIQVEVISTDDDLVQVTQGSAYRNMQFRPASVHQQTGVLTIPDALGEQGGDLYVHVRRENWLGPDGTVQELDQDALAAVYDCAHGDSDDCVDCDNDGVCEGDAGFQCDYQKTACEVDGGTWCEHQSYGDYCEFLGPDECHAGADAPSWPPEPMTKWFCEWVGDDWCCDGNGCYCEQNGACSEPNLCEADGGEWCEHDSYGPYCELGDTGCYGERWECEGPNPDQANNYYCGGICQNTPCSVTPAVGCSGAVSDLQELIQVYPTYIVESYVRRPGQDGMYAQPEFGLHMNHVGPHFGWVDEPLEFFAIENADGVTVEDLGNDWYVLRGMTPEARVAVDIEVAALENPTNAGFASFETQDTNPWILQHYGTMGVSDNATDGDASVSIGCHTASIVSPPHPTTDWGIVGDKLLVDVFVPSNANPYWAGTLNAGFRATSIEINQFIPIGNMAQLNTLPKGDWSTVEFDVPQEVQDVLENEVNRVEFMLFLNHGSCDADDYLLDNLRFGGNTWTRELNGGQDEPGVNNAAMSFDSLDDWGNTWSYPPLSNDDLVSDTELFIEGSASLGIVANSYRQLSSVWFTTDTIALEDVTDRMAMSIFVPEPQPNHYWAGYLNLSLECQGAGEIAIGTQDLELLAYGEFEQVAFDLDTATSDLFRDSNECRFHIVVNPSIPVDDTIRLDNIAFVPVD